MLVNIYKPYTVGKYLLQNISNKHLPRSYYT